MSLIVFDDRFGCEVVKDIVLVLCCSDTCYVYTLMIHIGDIYNVDVKYIMVAVTGILDGRDRPSVSRDP